MSDRTPGGCCIDPSEPVELPLGVALALAATDAEHCRCPVCTGGAASASNCCGCR
ncbi:hypothetical protein [Halobaculum sp. D14]|uniref:hypothetical protein n=1 Tax=Halobaculum sp. D14 TaxID=3421642 RepID=UPI003EB97BEB